ncbi:MAG: 30S ribosomal protein S18 [Planctomycetia bacterium]
MAKTRRAGKRCRFTVDGISPRPAFVDYKDVELLKKMMSGHGKMLSRRRTGNSAVYQRAVSDAIKRARFMGLLPYVGE